jgi:hypothetical protein
LQKRGLINLEVIRLFNCSYDSGKVVGTSGFKAFVSRLKVNNLLSKFTVSAI